MPADSPTPSSIITSALRKLGVMGSGETAVGGEDLELALNEFNEMVEQLNLRKRNAFFMRQQAFTFSVARVTYSIGTSANAANFVVDAGERPARIEAANLVTTNVTPNVELQCAVINVEQYVQIPVPTLSSQFPLTIYYQPTWPNGTIRPYPTSPTSTSYQLKLWWWDQLLTVAMVDVSAALVIPFGYRRALATRLAVNLWLSFPKRTDLEELKRQDRMAWADIQSVNSKPPQISSADGVSPESATFDWRSRQWM